MAWLETKGNVYRIRFRYGGSKRLAVLQTGDKKEAVQCLGRFAEHFRLIRRGIIAPPPPGSDLGAYILSGGKLTERPGAVRLPAPATLGHLFRGYRDRFPAKAKAESTMVTEKIHFGHLKRLLGADTPLSNVTAKCLQSYADARSSESGRNGQPIRSKTVKKELSTFMFVWNRWGVPEGMVSGPFPTGLVNFGKERARPPFQTWNQIERQIARGNLSKSECACLWECLFLTLDEVDEVLDFVRKGNSPDYVYPMFVFAAHTGARRSEIMRSRIDDFDLASGSLLIRERKKETAKDETYRTVPITPLLAEAITPWLAKHHGGIHTICTREGKPITRHWAAELFWKVFADSKWAVLPGWHCFRHSFISNCAAKGVDQRLIDHWVGHTTEAMRRRYSHLVPTVSKAALLSVFGKR